MLRLVLALSTVWFLACGAAHSDLRPRGKVTLVEPEAPADPYVIERDTLREVLARGPAWFIQQIAVEPVLAGGRFQGFMLLALFDRDPADESPGLRPGDIVQRVNGMPVERPDQFMKVWDSLADADHLSIRIVRDRQPLLITWAIR